MTPLDQAHAAMEAAPEDDKMRLRYFERLADAELFLLLEAEAKGDTISPRTFATDDGTFLLAFDREDRLTEFAGGAAPYAALSGRKIVQMITAQDIGLGMNLNAASAFLLPADGIAWLADILSEGPTDAQAKPDEIRPPGGLPERLIEGLDQKLAAAMGMAEAAYLAGVTYQDGRKGHMLAFIDAVPGAEAGLARAVSEALIFSGLEAGELDVAFLRASDQMSAALARHGLRFDLPRPPRPAQPDPNAPPKLR